MANLIKTTGGHLEKFSGAGETPPCRNGKL